MLARLRSMVPTLLVVLVVAAGMWAVSFPNEPPADFVFINGTEPQSLDPQRVTGQPEGRLVGSLFEGLLRWDPRTLEPRGGLAKNWTVSADGLIYTFYLRPACWSDGEPIDAFGVIAAWRRMLDPATAAEYAYQIWSVKGAKNYSVGLIAKGDFVEVELDGPPVDPQLPFARGRVVRGVLENIDSLDSRDNSSLSHEPTRESFSDQWIYTVNGQRYAAASHASTRTGDAIAARCILPNFQTTVGLHAQSDTLTVELQRPTPYFPQLLAFYPLAPVPMHVIDRYGSPGWTSQKHMVSSGPYRLGFRRLRDRIRLVRNDLYWDRESVKIGSIDALAIESSSTAFALFTTGAVDWNTSIPPFAARTLIKRESPELRTSPELTIGFYRINTTRAPLSDKRVRQALSLALDRTDIVQTVFGPGEVPSKSFVPSGIESFTGYIPAATIQENADLARQLLAEAGFPKGKGFPRITLSFNADEGHQMVAELVQAQWKEQLGIDFELVSMEWGAFLHSQSTLDFWIARSGWIGDYVDPNTFLDLFVTGGANNQTGFSSDSYDALIAAAADETDRNRRNNLFRDAEMILMQELPVLPLFVRTSKNLVAPWVRNFHNNPLDIHPLSALDIDSQARDIGRRGGR